MHLLNQIGLTAYPVLVNTKRSIGIKDALPAVNAFDHVIVSFKHNGKTYWIDPTLSLQGGQLNTLTPLPYKIGLPLSSTANGLTTIPGPNNTHLSTNIKEIFFLEDEGATSHTFKVSVSRAGKDADDYRRYLLETSKKEIQDNYLDYYAHYFPNIQLIGKLEVTDNRTDNMINTSETYQIHNLWESNDGGQQEATLSASDIYHALTSPRQLNRKAPFATQYPNNIIHQTEIHLSPDWQIEDEQATIENEGFTLEKNLTLNGDVIHQIITFQSLADHIKASALKQYDADIERAKTELDLGLYIADSAPEEVVDEAIAKDFAVLMLIYLTPLLIGTIIFASLATQKRDINDYGVTTLHPVSYKKFLILNIVSLNYYTLLWAYENWKYIQLKHSPNIKPFWRALFSIFYMHSLYKSISKIADEKGITPVITPTQSKVLHTAYLILYIISTYLAYQEQPLLSFIYIITLLPFAACINQLNQSDQMPTRYSAFTIKHAALIACFLPMVMHTILTGFRILPNQYIIEGTDLPAYEKHFLTKNGTLSDNEKLYYFFSDHLFSYRESGNGLTDQQIFGFYHENVAKITVSSYFNEIEQYELIPAGDFETLSTLTIQKKSSDSFIIRLPIDGPYGDAYIETFQRLVDNERQTD